MLMIVRFLPESEDSIFILKIDPFRLYLHCTMGQAYSTRPLEGH